MSFVALIGAVGWLVQPRQPVAPHRTVREASTHIVLGLTQVVTDIDDTIKSSGGIALAGIPLGGVDTSYTRNSFYPGVFQFGLELASAGRGRPNKMAILTARAEEFKWALEIKQSSKLCVRFRQAGEKRNIDDWGVGEVLYGSVAEWVCQERKGWRKFENFKILHAGLDPKTRYVFTGDNGKSEKDFEAAQMIIDEFPKAMRAVFLHAVSGDVAPAPLPSDTDYNGVPVLYFRTYATAAVKALEQGLFDARAARRVRDAPFARARARARSPCPCVASLVCRLSSTRLFGCAGAGGGRGGHGARHDQHTAGQRQCAAAAGRARRCQRRREQGSDRTAHQPPADEITLRRAHE